MDFYTIGKIEKSQIHDGDTIESVLIKLLHLPGFSNCKIFPELFIIDEYLCIVFNLRLKNVDAPELHPFTHNLDGSERSEDSRQKEKDAAILARDALIQLIESADRIFISSPEEGKYAGRLVAELFIERNGNQINVADYLIGNGYAVPYDGGTKHLWDF